MGYIFNKVITLGYFKLPFDKVLKGNIKLAYRDIWQEKCQCKGIAVSQFKKHQGSKCDVGGGVGGAGRVVGNKARDAKLAGLLLVGGGVDFGFFH